MIDLVLVNPNGRIEAPFAAIEPPLWLGLIAGYRLGLGKEVVIVDAEAEGLTVEQTVERVNSYDSKEIIIVVMGNNPSVSSTPKMPVADKLLKHLPGAKLTGLHPSAVNHPKAILKPFEDFPTVPWVLLPMEKYRAHNWHCLSDIDNRHPYAVLYTSLGCPYKCFYCNIHALYGQRGIQWRPMEDVYTELDYFASQNIRNIKIWDECFTLNKLRVRQICDYISSHSLNFHIWAYARLDSVDEALLTHMKRAGINWLAYGFENTSDKKCFNAETAIKQTQEAGINIIANFMFGLPGESFDNMQGSLEMVMRHNFEYVNFNVALPYPGSEWYASLEDKPTNWETFSQYSSNICASPEVIAFREYAFRSYFTRPEYLSMIRKKFGEKAEQHIKEMLAWKIRS